MTVNYIRLDENDVIIAAGMAPDRATYEHYISHSGMPLEEMVETETNLTSFIDHTYNRETGETTPPPVARPASLMASPTPITMEDLIIALDEKENGDPSKWNELLAQARNNTNGQPS